MSTVAITVDGVDRTSSILFARTSFEQSMNAVPGSFTITVRDPDRSLSFATGVEVSLEVDGVLLFGGYVTQVSMTHLAPAADTSDLSDYQLRLWVLRGTDYNIVFDRRVWRNTADYLHYIDLSAFVTDGAILRELVDNYADLSDFTSTDIEDIATISTGDVVQQGEKIRKEFENLSFFGGAVWYAGPGKNFVYKPYDDAEKRWGFSDVPNRAAITASPASYQGATIGYREVEGTEDGSYIVNDALVWGGSEFAGSGGTVFARTQDATSQSTYGRWQHAETHFGERLYRIQDQADARADVIVNGPPGADLTGQQKGLRFAQWQFTFKWHSVDVPLLSGVPDHIVPGDLVTIDMDVFGVTKLLPLRSLRTTFPDAHAGDDPNDRVVLFEGTFGLQLSDPFTLWRYILKSESRVARQTVLTVNESSTVTVYGAEFSGEPSPATDGVTTIFSIPFGYVSSTTEVYLNGLIQRRGTDYTESDNVAGEVTFSTPPLSTDNVWITCSTLSS